MHTPCIAPFFTHLLVPQSIFPFPISIQVEATRTHSITVCRQSIKSFSLIHHAIFPHLAVFSETQSHTLAKFQKSNLYLSFHSLQADLSGGNPTQRPPLPPASDPLPSFSLFNTTLPTILLPTHPASHRKNPYPLVAPHRHRSLLKATTYLPTYPLTYPI